MRTWYQTGTIAVTQGNMEIVGTGTEWAHDIWGIGRGHALVARTAAGDRVYEIDIVRDDTHIKLSEPVIDASASGLTYKIINFMPATLPDFGRKLSVQLGNYDLIFDNFQSLLTGTGNVTLVSPDGETTVVRSQSEWDRLLDTKVSLDTAQTIAGKKAFRQNWETITLVNESLGQPGYLAGRDFDGAVRWIFGYETPDSNYLSLRNSKANTVMLFHSNRNIYVECVNFIINNETVYTTGNTSKDTNGYLKAASPIIRIVNDPATNKRTDLIDQYGWWEWAGHGVANYEAKGVVISKTGVGTWTVSNSLGLAKVGWQVGAVRTLNGGTEIGMTNGEEREDGTVVITIRKIKFRLTPDGDLERYAGELIELPDDVWIDVRLDMPPVERPPVIPDAVGETSAQE